MDHMATRMDKLEHEQGATIKALDDIREMLVPVQAWVSKENLLGFLDDCIARKNGECNTLDVEIRNKAEERNTLSFGIRVQEYRIIELNRMLQSMHDELAAKEAELKQANLKQANLKQFALSSPGPPQSLLGFPIAQKLDNIWHGGNNALGLFPGLPAPSKKQPKPKAQSLEKSRFEQLWKTPKATARPSLPEATDANGIEPASVQEHNTSVNGVQQLEPHPDLEALSATSPEVATVHLSNGFTAASQANSPSALPLNSLSLDDGKLPGDNPEEQSFILNQDQLPAIVENNEKASTVFSSGESDCLSNDERAAIVDDDGEQSVADFSDNEPDSASENGHEEVVDDAEHSPTSPEYVPLDLLCNGVPLGTTAHVDRSPKKLLSASSGSFSDGKRCIHAGDAQQSPGAFHTCSSVFWAEESSQRPRLTPSTQLQISQTVDRRLGRGCSGRTTSNLR